MILEYSLDLLKRTSILEGVSEADLKTIFDDCSIKTLKSGEYLYKVGVEPEAMYLLLEGHLNISIPKRHAPDEILGVIRDGDMVCDVEFLSKTITKNKASAITDCVLLVINHEDFEKIKKHCPTFVYRLLYRSAERTQGILERSVNNLGGGPTNKCIFVVAANKHTNCAQLFQNIKDNLRGNYIIIDKFQTEEDLNTHHLNELLKYFDQLEVRYDQVIVLTTNSFLERHRLLLQKAESIYFVINNTEEVDFYKFAHSLLKKQHKNIFNHLIKNILIFKETDLKKIQHTKKWLQGLHIHTYFHIDDTKRDINRLIRYLTNTPVGLVLSGGFSYGWAHLGVIKFLKEHDIPIDFIVGSSVGAAIGSCFLVSNDLKEAEEKIRILNNALGDTASISTAHWPFLSIFDDRIANEALKISYGKKTIEDLPLPFFATSSNLNKESLFIYSQGLISRAVRASSAVPALLPPIIEDGEIFMDGGLLNNLPCDIAKNIYGLNSVIIACDLGMHRLDITKYRVTDSFSFMQYILDQHRKHKRYKIPPFFKTMLRALMLGSTQKQSENIKLADYHITPDLSDFETFEDDEVQIQKMIDIGYKKAKSVLKNKASILKGE